MKQTDHLYRLFLDHPSIATDTRNLKPGSIFFALKGEHFNGNLFASDALKKGAVCAVVDEVAGKPQKGVLLVESVIDTLQEMAKLHRAASKAKIIGITGSNGKTTTKELIGNVLSTTFQTIVTAGNLNNHIGVPLTILELRDTTELAVIEMGANHRGEIAQLCDIARPDFGIITNIGKAHLEGFGGFEGVIKAKSELYDFIRKHQGLIFYNLDNPLLGKISAGIRSISYGTAENAACIGSLTESIPFLSLDWKCDGASGSVKTSLFGEYNFENILAAIAIGNYFGVTPQNIHHAIKSYIPANNRSQVIDSGRNRIILDAYNANPSSLEAALLNFHKSLSGKPGTVILGDMMELGEESKEEHGKIVRLLQTLRFNKVILVGNHFSEVCDDLSMSCFPDTREASLWLKENPLEGTAILIKGSRLMKLEDLTPLL